MKWLADRIWLNLRSQMHFAKSFALSVASMSLNNVIWTVILLFMFTQTENIAGFTPQMYLASYGYLLIVFGAVVAPFGGLLDLWEAITDGNLDRFMLQPKSTLLAAASSRLDNYPLGDLVLGVVLLVVTHPPLRFLLFLPLSIVLFFSYMVIINSFYFFVEEHKNTLSRMLTFVPVSFAMWPIMVLPEPLRFFAYYVIPGGMMSFYPMQQAFTGGWAPELLIVTTVFVLAAALIWKTGMRRYTSTNLAFNVNE